MMLALMSWKQVSRIFWNGYGKLLGVLGAFGATLLLFMALAIGYEVFMRYVLDSPTQWVVEGTEYMLLYITFLSAAWLLPRGGHTRMTFFVELLSPRKALMMNTFSSLVAAAICGVLVWQTGKDTWELFREGLYLPQSIRFQKYLLWWIIPFGSLLLLIQFLRMVYDNVAALRTGAAEEKKEVGPQIAL